MSRNKHHKYCINNTMDYSNAHLSRPDIRILIKGALSSWEAGLFPLIRPCAETYESQCGCMSAAALCIRSASLCCTAVLVDSCCATKWGSGVIEMCC